MTRSKIVLGSAWLLMVLFLARAAYLQLGGNRKLQKWAFRQAKNQLMILPLRGPVLDRNGQPLAVSIRVYSLAMAPLKEKLSEKEKMLLSRILKISPHQRSKLFSLKKKTNKQFMWIKRHLSQQEMFFVQHFLEQLSLKKRKAFWFVQEYKRMYPLGERAAHVVGDVNIDLEGIEGVELWKNQILQGKKGHLFGRKDGKGRFVFLDLGKKSLSVQEGKSVTLTIDSHLQYKLYDILKKWIHKTQAQAGTVFVMNAYNGEIWALVNWPSFDSNRKPFRGSWQRRRNRALTDGFEPGSIMKPLLVAGALRHHWKLSQEFWGGKGKVLIGKKWIQEAQTQEAFGWMTLFDAVRFSSNVVMAKLALRLKEKVVLETYRLFGFGEKTDLGFPGEIRGWIKKKEAPLRPIELATLGFGQGLFVTALQMGRAYSVFLNGGKLVVPKLILKKQERKTKHVLSLALVKKMQKVLRAVVQTGTAQKAEVVPYEIAGKTGTAQRINPKTHQYSKTHYVSSFVGFSLRMKPHFVIFTQLQDPKTHYYASETAVPLFKEVFLTLAARFGYPFEGGKTLVSTRFLKKVQKKMVSKKRKHVSIRFSKKSIPVLEGLTVREALKILKQHGILLNQVVFKTAQKSFGLVKKQIPESGEKVLKKQKIFLWLE